MLGSDEPEAWERERLAEEVWQEEHPRCEGCGVTCCVRAELHGCGAPLCIEVGFDKLVFCDECAEAALQAFRIEIIADGIQKLDLAGIIVTREQAMERARNIENQLQFARKL